MNCRVDDRDHQSERAGERESLGGVERRLVADQVLGVLADGDPEPAARRGEIGGGLVERVPLKQRSDREEQRSGDGDPHERRAHRVRARGRRLEEVEERRDQEHHPERLKDSL